ncbi:XRE family transcriptional regulator [Gallibacterium sp. ZY190522]
MSAQSEQQKDQVEVKMDNDPFKKEHSGTKFSERLKQLIGNRSGRSFAKEVNISYSTLHNYLSDISQPTLDNLITLSKYAGVSIEWLALGTEPEKTVKNESEKTELNLYADNSYIIDYRNVLVSAGFGRFNDEIDNPDYTTIETSWLKYRGFKADDLAMFRVSGDSMYPTLKDNEDIIVNMAQKRLQEGKIFVINHQGSMWVKKIHFDFNGIKLISDNPTYPPITLTLEDIDALMIIGQVVRGYRDF